MQHQMKLKPAQIKGLRDWEKRVANSVDKPHRAAMRKLKDDGATEAQLASLEAKFQKERPALIEAEKQRRMDAYWETAEGKEMRDAAIEADFAYRQQLIEESQQQQ